RGLRAGGAGARRGGVARARGGAAGAGAAQRGGGSLLSGPADGRTSAPYCSADTREPTFCREEAMSVTVAVRCRARPGRADALLETTRRLLTPAVRISAPRSARVFRARNDAHDFLLIGDWDSQEAYWSSRQALGIGEQLDPLTDGAPEHYVFERLALF